MGIDSLQRAAEVKAPVSPEWRKFDERGRKAGSTSAGCATLEPSG
jgi:hypothetical protein